MSLDQVQFIGTCVALALQLLATGLMIRPLKNSLPKALWHLLMALNLCVLARRVLTLFEVVVGWSGQTCESLAVAIGLGVSVFMILTVIGLRKHVEDEKQKAVSLAKATVDLAVEQKAEDSLAYQLALHFVEVRERTDALIDTRASVQDARDVNQGERDTAQNKREVAQDVRSGAQNARSDA